MWSGTPLQLKMVYPKPGYIVAWNHYRDGFPTVMGHCGIVKEVLQENEIITIEGNTSASSGIDREGGGIFEKIRILKPENDMRLLGFIDPFGL